MCNAFRLTIIIALCFCASYALAQATAASLNATVVGTGTFGTQSTVTQGTSSNLKAQAYSWAASAGAVSHNRTMTGVGGFLTAMVGWRLGHNIIKNPIRSRRDLFRF